MAYGPTFNFSLQDLYFKFVLSKTSLQSSSFMSFELQKTVHRSDFSTTTIIVDVFLLHYLNSP